jgi:hypothetical protein
LAHNLASPFCLGRKPKVRVATNGVIPSLFKGVFFYEIEIGEFFFEWGLTQGVFFGWHGKEKFGCFSR